MFPKIRLRDFFFLAGVVLLIIAFVVVITTPAIFSVFDLSKKAALGDALNGLTAPVVGLVGAFLVYLSFREQQEANRIQAQALQVQRRLDFIFRSYEELRADLEKIQTVYGTKYAQPSMLDAFMQQIFRDVDEKTQYPDLLEFIQYVNLQLFHLGGMLIGSHHTLGTDDSHLLLSKLRYLYQLYFKKYYDQIMSREWKSALAGSFRANIYFLYNLMDHVDKNIERLIDEDFDAIRKRYGLS